MLSPEETGQEIRRLLFELRASDHGHDSSNYETDALRRRALEIAGICWLGPGEMAPMCGCEWSLEDPTGASEHVDEDHAERRMLWRAISEDGCAVPHVKSSQACARGTYGCLTKHQ